MCPRITRPRRAMPPGAVLLAVALIAVSCATLVAGTASATSRSGVRFAVANAASLSDMGTAASLVAAGSADAVLFAQSSTGLGSDAAFVVARHAPIETVLVGGHAVLGHDIEAELRRLSPDVELARLSGADRIDTAARTAHRSVAAGSQPTLVLANGWSLPDVGTAASLVATGGGDAVLYTHSDHLGEPTREAISLLRPGGLVIVGGPAAVASAVVDELAGLAPDVPVVRRQGATRVETATAAARRALESGATHVVIATGWSAGDVGIAAAIAAADPDAAVLYATQRGRLGDTAAELISRHRPARATLVGDESRLPGELVDELTARSSGTRIERIGELECPTTPAEASARAAVLAAEPRPGSASPGESSGTLRVAIESCADRHIKGAFEARFSFSEPVSGFEASDIAVVNGTVSYLIGAGTHHQAVVQPGADGAVVVRVPAGAVRSLDGDRNESSAPFVRLRSPASGLPAAGLDTWNRPLVVQSHQAEFERDEPDPGYTGDFSGCDAGTTSEEFRRSVIQRVNWYRSMAGLDPVTEHPELSLSAQSTALMMLAEGRLSHFPEPDWACHSAIGVAVAAKSNLGLGSAGIAGIDGYMRDAGDNNWPVGHRRWILYPQALEMGTGNAWHSSHRFRAANALDILSGERRSGQPDVRQGRGFVSWPPAGYVPSGVMWGRWSFSLAEADFADAAVAAFDDSGPVKTKILEREPGAGDPSIVWAMAGDTDSRLLSAPRDGDRCYAVTVSGVRIGGETQPPYEYPVCVIDPKAPTGPSVTLESTSSAGVGDAFEVTITFSESVDGFTSDDIDVFNGTVAEFSGSGRRYVAVIRADDNGTVAVSVGSGAVHDADFRPNTPAAPLVRTADVDRPTASITSSARSAVSGSFDVTITFSEPVTGLDLSDIRVVNGTASNRSGSGSSFRATISPDSDGTVMVRMLQDAATSASGRSNAASQPFTRLKSPNGRASGIGIDTWDRRAVLGSYTSEFGRDEPDAGYTGDVGECEPGTTSADYRGGVMQRLNWYRALAGLGSVAENAEYTSAAQHAALVNLANGSFEISPASQCYTVQAENAAAEGSGWLGIAGLRVIDSYVRMDGNHNLRMTVLDPHLNEVGIGHAIDADRTYQVSHRLYRDNGNAWNATRPRVREERRFVAWPPAGYVAEGLVPQKWSFSLPNADFSDAVVSVADHIGPLPVRLLGTEDWYREETFAWTVDVLAAAVGSRKPTDADHCFTVHISGVRVSGTAQDPYEYAVCVSETGNSPD